MASLKNEAERRVVAALRDRLSDSWLVLPSVGLFGDRRDRELDVVLVHERDGVAVVEVKGHRPSVIEGVWYCGGVAMDPQPYAQARDNAYALRGLLRGLHPSLGRLEVACAEAFPNVDELRGRLPADIDRSQLLTNSDLEDCMESIERLMARRYSAVQLGPAGVRRIVDALRPNCEFGVDAEARARQARSRLEAISAERVQALEGLDANRRVCVTGAAGTGKSRLALAWARRALIRRERVLLTCFNIPLAEWLAEQVGEDDGLCVGAFHDVALALEGMPPLDVPADADRQWWDTVEFGHLDAHWHEVTERFDTIVVDEAQDFRPSWLEMLARLLDPAGPRRLMLLADVSQSIYPRGFQLPRTDDGWTLCELTANCRNTFEIATLLRRRFGGAVAPVGGPESEDVRWVEAGDADALTDAVGEAIDRLEGREHGAETILVATFTGSVRDRLLDEFGLVRWEHRQPGAILCENVQRIKGLQYDHVVLAVHEDGVADDLLYVGISRAVMSLTVIGPRAVGERLGLSTTESPGSGETPSQQ